MGIAKTGWMALMVVVLGLNGLFGGSGMAALCFHESADVHLVIGGHEAGHTDCSPSACCDSEVGGDSGVPLIRASCDEGCFDLSLQGIDREFTLSQRLSKTPSPLVMDRELIFTGSVDRSGYERIRVQLAPRGPPLASEWIERIKITVLRV